MEDYASPPSLCLRCGYYVDHAAKLTGKTGPPEPGDFTLCLNCGQLFRFNKQLGLVLTGNEAISELAEPKQRTVRVVQDFIARRGPIAKKDKPT